MKEENKRKAVNKDEKNKAFKQTQKGNRGLAIEKALAKMHTK